MNFVNKKIEIKFVTTVFEIHCPRNLDAGTISIFGNLLSGSIFADIHLNRHSLPVSVRDHYSKRKNQERFPFLIGAYRRITSDNATYRNITFYHFYCLLM